MIKPRDQVTDVAQDQPEDGSRRVFAAAVTEQNPALEGGLNVHG
jgi:hypothetical protein